MEILLIIGVIIVAILVIAGSQDQQKAEDKKRQKIEQARLRILNSGNQQLIDQLHLMDATQESRKSGNKSGPSGLEIAGGVVGGIVIADIITNAAHARALEQAFADIQENMNTELSALGIDVDPGEFDGGGEDEDGDWLEDLL